MGFFSDLKDDLSQAVNELMPEEELEAALAAQGQAKEQTSADGETAEAPAADVSLDSLNLSDMLDKIEELEPVEETAPVAEEPEPVAEEPAVEEALTEEITTEEPEIPEEEAVIEEPAAPEVAEAVIEEEEAEPVMAEEILTEVETPEKETEEVQNGGGKGKTMETQANRVAVDETAVVTEGMTITGDIVSEGSLELIGTVNGNLDILGKLNITGTIQGNSKAAEIYAEGSKITGEVNSLGSVKIGQNSVVIGNITATSAVVAGAVKGDIDVQGPVILDTTAIVMGNIKSKSVQINNGAVIEGMCSQCYADVNPTSFFEEFKKKK
ncbi:MAG: polymer-forming cytoskeletal protein [Lachnospiraceae bacterium]|nr:polymer-forming cytoskeletal protein [Lachnospiraceae bacterium]